ncbi:MAG: type I glyceraldehyde-3-phosphate dehydrogenase [Proteobacteria bacterium]|nr:type I glyceraldehyde-3-phosphate dehydrogenase [Pseudomonadota bacterium]
MRVAINGFGRIGRMVLRALVERKEKDLQIKAVNDLGPLGNNVHLFKYDSVHGCFEGNINISNNAFEISYHDYHTGPIKDLSCTDPQTLPWKELGIDIVLECTGRFTKRSEAALHLKAGAKRVLISAPCEDADKTVVFGINQSEIKPEDQIISNGSCTTNCLVPVAYVLHKSFGIQYGYMTTVHAYTGDQRLVDTFHTDLRRARASTLSMIPTSTGAAKAVSQVLPELKGKLDGSAIRVPVSNVSVVDFKFTSQNRTSIEEINQAIQIASEGFLKGVLATNKEPLVSIDFNHRPESSIFDLTQTQVIDGRFCRILSWYDNEWGFSNRMVDVALLG